MSESYHSPQSRPSATGAFFRGFGSGALSSSFMMGILYGVTKLATLIPALVPYAAALPALPVMLTTIGVSAIAIGLFSGTMAAKRALFDAPSHDRRAHDSYVAIPTPGVGTPTIVPVMGQDVVPAQPTQHTPSNWVEKSGRQVDAQTRIQQILANQAMSDKDRASAILAARESSPDAMAAR
jgi:hypothetical protein